MSAQPAGCRRESYPERRIHYEEGETCNPIQIKAVFSFIPMGGHEVRLVYWTLGLTLNEVASIEVTLLCRPLHLAGVEIVIALDDRTRDASSPS